MFNVILGTAQFGLDYGITNHNGKVEFNEISKIVDLALKSGINMVDTAKNYGDSENLLSKFQNFKVVTKINLKQISGEKAKPGFLIDAIKESLINLRRNRIDALLIHDTGSLLDRNDSLISEEIAVAKKKGLVHKFGVSLYDPFELYEVIDKVDMDIVQLPFNIFDQRFLNSGCLKYLNERNIEVHARSLFLQGALLSSKTPNVLKNWESHFDRLRKRCATLKVSLLEYCVCFAISNLYSGSSIVIGVTSTKELKDIIEVMCSKMHDERWQELSSSDLRLIDPRKWN